MICVRMWDAPALCDDAAETLHHQQPQGCLSWVRSRHPKVVNASADFIGNLDVKGLLPPGMASRRLRESRRRIVWKFDVGCFTYKRRRRLSLLRQVERTFCEDRSCDMTDEGEGRTPTGSPCLRLGRYRKRVTARRACPRTVRCGYFCPTTFRSAGHVPFRQDLRHLHRLPPVRPGACPLDVRWRWSPGMCLAKASQMLVTRTKGLHSVASAVRQRAP